MQQCEMYQQIVERLLAEPEKFTQKKRTDEFCIELLKDKQQEIHKLSLITKRGTSSVLCDRNFLINLQNDINHHLNACET
jgi:chromosome condensin MukBEF ATPase and DNA-binding subunit MukB